MGQASWGPSVLASGPGTRARYRVNQRTNSRVSAYPRLALLRRRASRLCGSARYATRRNCVAPAELLSDQPTAPGRPLSGMFSDTRAPCVCLNSWVSSPPCPRARASWCAPWPQHSQRKDVHWADPLSALASSWRVSPGLTVAVGGQHRLRSVWAAAAAASSSVGRSATAS